MPPIFKIKKTFFSKKKQVDVDSKSQLPIYFSTNFILFPFFTNIIIGFWIPKFLVENW
jgi:hypothetical protein